MTKYTLPITGLMLLLLSGLMAACGGASQQPQIAEQPAATPAPSITYDTNKPVSLVQAVAHEMGGMDGLKALRDVQFDYIYHSLGDDKKDISIERYVFEGEKSWARYTTHEINVFPGVAGEAIQYFDGDSAYCSLNGEALSEPQAIVLADFLRQANYFWFTMPFKLADPGTTHAYQGQEERNGKVYDKVLVSYDPAVTGKEQNDTYILYIDPKTRLIDCFFFSLPFMGVNQPALFMEVDYKSQDGVTIPVKRRAYFPGPDGQPTATPGLEQTMENIRFKNQFTAADLSI